VVDLSSWILAVNVLTG